MKFDCQGTMPVVTVDSHSQVLVYVYPRNYEDVSGFAGRFAVNGGSGVNTWGDWTLLGASFSCILGQTAQVPVQSAPPPIEPGELTTSFQCVTGGALRALGWMLFQVGTTGCLGIEDRALGTGVESCTQLFTVIEAYNRGLICVGPGGREACEPDLGPIQSDTWGRIKGQYR
jgi:hypothetical protein